ncbi:hypothetical protein K0B03_00180 [Patescibacteria group bacterium]|nr:hypothetical protein [Patescibacteria group bacterium]
MTTKEICSESEFRDTLLMELLKTKETGITSKDLFNVMQVAIPDDIKKPKLAQLNDVLRELASKGLITINSILEKGKYQYFDIYPNDIIKVSPQENNSLLSLLRKRDDDNNK